ncbi:MAG TPA: protein kinase [Kofleriaceae bacterium]|jgi:serine/threonine protein kinase
MAAGSGANARTYVITTGPVALIELDGVIDETFTGFGDLPDAKALVIDVGGVTRMTSFGVARWIAALDKIPKSVTESYLLRCPTVFVDQLNMVLGFGRGARVLTFFAPYLCPSCSTESLQMIDVVASHNQLARGAAPDRTCPRCSAALALDESESFFSFVANYGATGVSSDVARVLEETRRYRAQAVMSDKPPRVIKLVNEAVTYYRLIGTIGEAFRARPFLVGAEGEVVFDLAEIESFDPSGLPEWKRLLKSLSAQVSAITLVDITAGVLQHASETLTMYRNLAVASVLVPFKCEECGRSTPTSHSLIGKKLSLGSRVCPVCGGKSRCELSVEQLAPLEKAATRVPEATEKVIRQRAELVSRAVTDANVANAGEASDTKSGELIFGKYKIVRPLSAGGMADVFLATQLGIGGFEKTVALKRIQRKLLESRQMAVDMFLNEAKIAGRLTHPNIVQVLDVGEAGGALYLAMEFVRGKDLREVIKKQKSLNEQVPLAIACHVVREVARALHHAYWSKDMDGKQLSVVHRDVTPHNVILSLEGQVKLLDFGVAMSAVTEQQTSMIVGKWAYMSPEHSSGGAIDHRSDLFSLGVIFYLLLTGAMPFPGPNPKEIVRKTREGRFAPVLSLRPDAPPELVALATRLLAIDPAARPQTGKDVADTLERAMRQHELNASAPQIMELLAKLFKENTPDPTRPAQDERDLTQKISGFALGTSPNVPHPDESAERSPVSFSQQIGQESESLLPRDRSAPAFEDSVSLVAKRKDTHVDDGTQVFAGAPVPARPDAQRASTPAIAPRAQSPALFPRAPTAVPRAQTNAPTVISSPMTNAPISAPAPMASPIPQTPSRTNAPYARAATQSPQRRDDQPKKKPMEISARLAIIAFVVLAVIGFLIFRFA